MQAAPQCAEVLRVFVRPGEPECQEGTLSCPLSVTVLYRSADGELSSASSRMTATAKAELADGESAAMVRVVSAEGFAAPSQGASGREGCGGP